MANGPLQSLGTALSHLKKNTKRLAGEGINNVRTVGVKKKTKYSYSGINERIKRGKCREMKEP